MKLYRCTDASCTDVVGWERECDPVIECIALHENGARFMKMVLFSPYHFKLVVEKLLPSEILESCCLSA